MNNSSFSQSYHELTARLERERQELEDYLSIIDKDMNMNEGINVEYNKYIKSKDLNIGNLKKLTQIYNNQVNKCELTSTELICSLAMNLKSLFVKIIGSRNLTNFDSFTRPAVC